MNAHARTALARLRLAAISGGMSVEDADANCRELEGAIAARTATPLANDSLPDGWYRVYDFDKVDYSEGYNHVSGAWCRHSAFDEAEWFCAASAADDASPIKCVTPLAAMAAALRGGK